MNPFALANDFENKIRLLVDKKVFDSKTVTFHPMQNDALIEITSDDFKKFLKEIKKDPMILDFAELKKGI